MRTRTLSLLVTVGLAAVVGSADTAHADPVPFPSLPVAKPFTPPDQPATPAKIPATEHADGFFVVLAPEEQRRAMDERGYHYVQVFATEREAQNFATTGAYLNPKPNADGPRMCLANGDSLASRLSFYINFPPVPPTAAEIALLKKQHRWPPPQPKPARPTRPAAKPAKPAKPVEQRDRVQVVRLERLVQTPDGATLETTEAFVDLNTLGSRTLSKSSTHLGKVAGGPNNLGVYAAREEVGTTVQFLVTNPQLPTPADEADQEDLINGLEDTAERVVAETPSSATSESGCGYVRFSLAAKPGIGQMATVLATAFLPPTKDQESTDDSRITDDMTEDQIKEVRAMVHRENRAQRARTVAVNLSFSQLETEPAPLLSVTFGWAGKDQLLRF